MLALTDCRIDQLALLSLEKQGYKSICLPTFNCLPKPVSAHPDMLIFVLSDTLVTHTDYYKIARKQIDEITQTLNLKLCLSDEKISHQYPNDVLFNAAVIGKYLIANMDLTSKEIRRLAEKTGLTPIHINQGYAKCSLCVVSENAVVTSDKGIVKALSQKTELNILEIREGFVDLDGYNHGFIGGASGTDRDNVYFCGDLSLHPDGEKIVRFCAEQGKKAVSLLKTPLCDVGTIFCFGYDNF